MSAVSSNGHGAVIFLVMHCEKSTGPSEGQKNCSRAAYGTWNLSWQRTLLLACYVSSQKLEAVGSSQQTVTMEKSYF